jgi:23S rRNA (uracil1939-C5)-methyltransferase
VARCGGCPWLLASPEEEREYKIGNVRTLLQRLELPDVRFEFVDAPERVRYRNRIRLRVSDSGAVGFFNPDKSHACAVLRPELQAFVVRLREWARDHHGELVGVSHLEVRAPDADGHSGLLLTERVNGACKALEPDVARRLAADLSPMLIAIDHQRPMPQQSFAHHADLLLYVPLNGFVQVNSSVNLLLVEHLVRLALEGRFRSFVDLYGGAGNFALPLAQSGLSGSLIERNPDCVHAAARSARAAHLKVLDVRVGDAIAMARARLVNGERVDLVIVDPPRAGVRSGLEVVTALATQAIAYCSCNLVTLERDLRALIAAGWRLQRLVGFDMFPGTRHQETLAWLEPTFTQLNAPAT